ncbi:polycystin-2 [Elysia marginata]|uniref:Polycystin-2 n=1 Tax=Elysia marginata TaxID=1093978 RepID=A0AAV4EN08_9GAST|nr:polycystin-2 [Elysia marginata]
MSVCLCCDKCKNLEDQLHYGYLSRKEPAFVDFFQTANLDLVCKSAGGFLIFTCIFQIFDMLSKIRRLLIFIRLLKSALYLFLMPLVTGLAFAFLANMLFGKTIENFSNLSISFLVINQYFIKPQAIYETLTAVHPYLGPYYVFALGFTINFFVVTFFISFLNEAYSSIINQIRIQKYKTQEKTKLEYVYEFLGIQSTINWDREEELKFLERDNEKDLIKNIKQLLAH